jgi:hypothetical protein
MTRSATQYSVRGFSKQPLGRYSIVLLVTGLKGMRSDQQYISKIKIEN